MILDIIIVGIVMVIWFNQWDMYEAIVEKCECKCKSECSCKKKE